ncbi:MAG: DNA ligase [Rhodocyclaceae bacterium]|nr:DNA ligase [Rhodocyclaceae bacterium]MBX3668812.1 DNA ligase [Rhodocyclaceae bacterium]
MLCAALAPLARAQAGAAPRLMLADTYTEGSDPRGYWVSEKLDGMRGYWDGKRLLTRGGNPIAAPDWFTAGWPDHPLDGELWAGRGKFEETVSTVRSQVPDDAAWRRIRYMLFDLPAHPGSFDERVPALKEAVARIAQPWVEMIEQTPATTAVALKLRLQEVVRAGGEGLVLHRGDAKYRAGRTGDLLKYKPYYDAEARVLAHLPGRGKYAGMTGALLVETPDGRKFRIGSGLGDAERRQPPPLGSWITFRYRERTKSGLPRFPTYQRLRLDWEAPAKP